MFQPNSDICCLLSSCIHFFREDVSYKVPVSYRFEAAVKKSLAFLCFFTAISFATEAQELDVAVDLQKDDTGVYNLTIPLPEGVYRVHLILGSEESSGHTVVRAESRRLYATEIVTEKGEFKEFSFTVHRRSPLVSPQEKVRLKPREIGKLNWDDFLNLEISGRQAQLSQLSIEEANEVPVVYLCGNSTVVDQDNEPWASWGQMITVFFDDRLCFANYAESGESANSFISAGRLKKIMTQIKPGDYVLVEFGHNDQKQKGEGKGAYLSYWKSLTGFIDQAREKKAIPVLITPTQRRSFGDDGRIVDTHEDYPQAMRDLAREKQVPLIDLHQMTRVMYEALGTEGSKKAFVHYPAGSFPGQNQDLADNTHFNPYGAYQIAKCVVMGMKQLGLPLVQFLREEVVYDPAFPDDPGSFNWWPSPYVELQKPEGN